MYALREKMSKVGIFMGRKLSMTSKNLHIRKKLTSDHVKRMIVVFVLGSAIMTSAMTVVMSLYLYDDRRYEEETGTHVLLVLIFQTLGIFVVFMVRASRDLNPGEFISKFARKRCGILIWFAFATIHFLAVFLAYRLRTPPIIGTVTRVFGCISTFVVAAVRGTANFRDSIAVSRSIVVETAFAFAFQWYYVGAHHAAVIYILPVTVALVAHIPCPGSLDHVYCDSTDRIPMIFVEFRSLDF